MEIMQTNNDAHIRVGKGGGVQDRPQNPML